MQIHCVLQHLCCSNLCFSLIKHDLEGMSQEILCFLSLKLQFACKTPRFCMFNVCLLYFLFVFFVFFLSWRSELKGKSGELVAGGGLRAGAQGSGWAYGLDGLTSGVG